MNDIKPTSRTALRCGVVVLLPVLNALPLSIQLGGKVMNKFKYGAVLIMLLASAGMTHAGDPAKKQVTSANNSGLPSANESSTTSPLNGLGATTVSNPAAAFSGFYLGGGIGRRGAMRSVDGSPEGNGSVDSWEAAQNSLRVYGGYNFLLGDNIIVGPELGFYRNLRYAYDATTDDNGDDLLLPGTGFRQTANVAYLSGRLGYVAGPFMPYLTAGISGGNILREIVDDDGNWVEDENSPVSQRHDISSYFGAGVEYLITDSIVGRAEVSRATLALPDGDWRRHNTTFSMGIAYKF